MSEVPARGLPPNSNELLDSLKVGYMLETGGGVPQIVLDPSSKRADQLRLKLVEYENRVEKLKINNSRNFTYFAELKFRQAMISKLLDNGTINIFDSVQNIAANMLPGQFSVSEAISLGAGSIADADDSRIVLKEVADSFIHKELAKSNGFSMSEDSISKEAVSMIFDAFMIVEDYAVYGGQNLSRGTGLAQVN